MNVNLSQLIKAEALRLGFFSCGVAQSRFLEEDREFMNKWLEAGKHADMSYLERNQEVRFNPEKLVENAKSVIVVLLNYFNPEKPEDPKTPIISKYAYGADYHFIIKDKLKELVNFVQCHQPQANALVFTDSAPILERRWAQLAGLGWIGKNSCLITKEQGSFFFIGEIVTDLELDYDDPFTADYCGNCSKCIDACPTAAICSDKSVDARKCISYQTIENKGELPQWLKPEIANRVFGCDICQDVCPWNKKALPNTEKAFMPNPKLLKMSAEDWKNLSPESYKVIFKNSAVERAKFKGLKRNCDFLEL